MATPGAIKRLTREYRNLQVSPLDLIEAHPSESDLLNWYYVITGAPGTPYEGGQYLGELKFPPTYPFRPPSILMITPSGRFQPNVRLCLSVSDYHPEQWNPAWNVGTILTGLLSFMSSEENTSGVIRCSIPQRKQYAKKSQSHNAGLALFKKEFPHLLDGGSSKTQNKSLPEAVVRKQSPVPLPSAVPKKRSNDKILKEVLSTTIPNQSPVDQALVYQRQVQSAANVTSQMQHEQKINFIDLDDEIEEVSPVRKRSKPPKDQEIVDLEGNDPLLIEDEASIRITHYDDQEVFIID